MKVWLGNMAVAMVGVILKRVELVGLVEWIGLKTRVWQGFMEVGYMVVIIRVGMTFTERMEIAKLMEIVETMELLEFVIE